MGKTKMELIVKKSQAVCPGCSGLITRMGQGDYYKCIDCRSIYKGQEAGYVEGAIVVDKVKEADHERNII
ncbi:MAG: hypothetical protein K2N01_13285 [Lachnospiraceae bacterium]|nr:hypothetical protein [Lachnospiraceae bacterium]